MHHLRLQFRLRPSQPIVGHHQGMHQDLFRIGCLRIRLRQYHLIALGQMRMYQNCLHRHRCLNRSIRSGHQGTGQHCFRSHYLRIRHHHGRYLVLGQLGTHRLRQLLRLHPNLSIV